VTSLSLLLVLEVVDELLDERSLVLPVPSQPYQYRILFLLANEEGEGESSVRSRLDLGVDSSGGLGLRSTASGRPGSETGEAVDTEGDVLVEDLLAWCEWRCGKGERGGKREGGGREEKEDLRKEGLAMGRRAPVGRMLEASSSSVRPISFALPFRSASTCSLPSNWTRRSGRLLLLSVPTAPDISLASSSHRCESRSARCTRTDNSR
jgi:hypothetical protein